MRDPTVFVMASALADATLVLAAATVALAAAALTYCACDECNPAIRR
jgi:hypothetical protein